MQLIGVPRPVNFDNTSNLLDVDIMIKMIYDKRKERYTEHDLFPDILRSGFIDTSHGVTLTSRRAMELVRAREKCNV